MSDTARLSPPDLFTSLIEGLFADITARVTNPWGRLTAVEWLLIKLIWRQLRRMSRRFATILAQLRAGTLPPLSDSAPHAAAADRPAAPPRPSRRAGWVIHAISYFVWMRHYELQELLDDPETQALVADAPQLGSVLRSLCRMLKVKPPAWLRRPRAPRSAATIPPAPDWLLDEPRALLRPDGSVWMHLGSSTHWRPGSGQTLQQAQKLDPPRRIWPRE